MQLSISPALKQSAAGLLVFACTLSPVLAQSDDSSAKAADKGKEAALSPVEQGYLQAVVSDNLGELVIAYFALEKAVSEDVKSNAKDIIDTHTKTMKEVLTLASKHNLILKLQPDLTSYEKLQAHGGGDFDKAYAVEMQALNQKAIDKLNPLMSQLTADDVKSFAESDLKDDKEHAKSAQELTGKFK